MTAKRGIVIGASVAFTVVLAGCDPWAGRILDNQCGVAVEATTVDRFNGQVSGDVTTIAPGDAEEIGTVASSIDLLVREVGEEQWPITITWEAIQTLAPEYGDTITLEGALCPPTDARPPARP